MIVIPSNLSSKIDVIAGSLSKVTNQPITCWHPDSVKFLIALGKGLMKKALVAKLADVVTLAYWLRAANLEQLRNQNLDHNFRIGLGLLLHICPSNVPINFAYSLAFGLITGNNSILRLSSKSSASTDLIVDVIKDLLADKLFQDMSTRIAVLRHQHDDEIMTCLMSQVDGRIIWGGDATIQYMRKFKMPARSREVAFADRYSIALLNPKAVLSLDEASLVQLAQRLFNDVLIMDQAACSSPQLFIWVSDDNLQVEAAQIRIWPELARVSQARNAFSDIGQMNKLVDACNLILAHDDIQTVQYEEEAISGLLIRLKLKGLPKAPENLRGYFGTLIELQLSKLDELTPIVNERYQTLSYFGFDATELLQWVLGQRLRGIDRIVPVGKAIDMGLLWDGHDLLSSLSRSIELHSPITN